MNHTDEFHSFADNQYEEPKLNDSITDSELRDLYIQIQSNNNKIIVIEQLLPKVQDKIQQMQTTIKNLKTQVQILQNKNKTSTSEIEQAKKRVLSLEQSNVDISNDRDAINTHLQRLQKDNEKLGKATKNLQTEKKEEIEKIQTEKAKCEELVTELQDKNQAITTNCKTTTSELNRTLSDTHEKLKSCESNNKILEHACNQSKGIVEALSKNLSFDDNVYESTLKSLLTIDPLLHLKIKFLKKRGDNVATDLPQHTGDIDSRFTTSLFNKLCIMIKKIHIHNNKIIDWNSNLSSSNYWTELGDIYKKIIADEKYEQGYNLFVHAELEYVKILLFVFFKHDSIGYETLRKILSDDEIITYMYIMHYFDNIETTGI